MGMHMYTHFKFLTCIHMHTWFIHITFHWCLATTDLLKSIINAVNILQIVIQHKVPSIGTFVCFPQVSFSPSIVIKVLSEAFFGFRTVYKQGFFLGVRSHPVLSRVWICAARFVLWDWSFLTRLPHRYPNSPTWKVTVSQRSLSQSHPPSSGSPPPGRGYCEGSHSCCCCPLWGCGP